MRCCRLTRCCGTRNSLKSAPTSTNMAPEYQRPLGRSWPERCSGSVLKRIADDLRGILVRHLAEPDHPLAAHLHRVASYKRILAVLDCDKCAIRALVD